MGGVGHEGTIRPKQGAREVQALLDVDTDAGALQCAPHLLCNAHEPAEGCLTECVIEKKKKKKKKKKKTASFGNRVHSGRHAMPMTLQKGNGYAF